MQHHFFDVVGGHLNPLDKWAAAIAGPGIRVHQHRGTVTAANFVHTAYPHRQHLVDAAATVAAFVGMHLNITGNKHHLVPQEARRDVNQIKAAPAQAQRMLVIARNKQGHIGMAGLAFLGERQLRDRYPR